METLRSSQASASPVQVVLFDFDGTISTLRTGWEEVMRTVMFRYLSHGQAPSPALRAEIDAYIEESTGIQTIYQMKWLRGKSARAAAGRAGGSLVLQGRIQPGTDENRGPAARKSRCQPRRAAKRFGSRARERFCKRYGQRAFA